ncbi:MAG: translation elongation factor-like protein [Anaerolineae bacterium]|jgi:putative protease
MEEKQIGTVSHWFGKIKVIGISLTDDLAVGDTIHIQGYTTDFQQEVTSMQIEGSDVAEAGAGDEVGVKVAERARAGDAVYKVV